MILRKLCFAPVLVWLLRAAGEETSTMASSDAVADFSHKPIGMLSLPFSAPEFGLLGTASASSMDTSTSERRRKSRRRRRSKGKSRRRRRSSSKRRRRRRRRRRSKSSTRRRKSSGGGEGQSGGSSEHRRRQGQTPTEAPTLPPTTRNPFEVVLPPEVEFVGHNGCASKDHKLYNGIVAAQKKWTTSAATETMTRQRCVDLLAALKGTPGLRGMRYAENYWNDYSEDGTCIMLGDNGFEGKVKQIRNLPGQETWPDQCCNPCQGCPCAACSFVIQGPLNGGKGPIDNPGGGASGFSCYKLVDSVGLR